MVLTEAAHTKTATHIQRTIVGRQNARTRIPSAMRFALRYATRYSCGIMTTLRLHSSEGQTAGRMTRVTLGAISEELGRARAKESARVGKPPRTLRAKADDGERDERQPDEEQRERLGEAFIRWSERVAIRLEETDEFLSPPQAAAFTAADGTAIANRVHDPSRTVLAD